jgi:FtsP/CotA-like multicopper oxidase with cupredoxin domain
MYGAFIIHDEEERALGLPSGEFDIPVVMQDVRRDEAGQLIYSPEHMDHMEGYMGNVMLTNGTPDAMLNVKRGTYRFRLLNASNARLYHLVIDVDHPFTIIASDGGLLEKPVTVTDLWMGPAERYDILVDFSSLPLSIRHPRDTWEVRSRRIRRADPSTSSCSLSKRKLRLSIKCRSACQR